MAIRASGDAFTCMQVTWLSQLLAILGYLYPSADARTASRRNRQRPQRQPRPGGRGGRRRSGSAIRTRVVLTAPTCLSAQASQSSSPAISRMRRTVTPTVSRSSRKKLICACLGPGVAGPGTCGSRRRRRSSRFSSRTRPMRRRRVRPWCAGSPDPTGFGLGVPLPIAVAAIEDRRQECPALLLEEDQRVAVAGTLRRSATPRWRQSIPGPEDWRKQLRTLGVGQQTDIDLARSRLRRRSG
jgi:hypothetical protein